MDKKRPPLARRPNAYGIFSMGIAGFLDAKYAHKGGFARFEEMILSGASNRQIADEFSSSPMKLSGHAVAYWRKKWQEERAEK